MCIVDVPPFVWHYTTFAKRKNIHFAKTLTLLLFAFLWLLPTGLFLCGTSPLYHYAIGNWRNIESCLANH